ncbi:hypothetical protein HY212_05705 [Candidatus Pacearchaeota archaeon]|nr:hypothetical protein [Candidatus Pacearchaeota archaeon]
MVKVKFCLKCKKSNIINVRGDGLWWKCLECGFQMENFPERDTNKKPSKLNKS